MEGVKGPQATEITTELQIGQAVKALECSRAGMNICPSPQSHDVKSSYAGLAGVFFKER
jgi:hypothetical protein